MVAHGGYHNNARAASTAGVALGYTRFGRRSPTWGASKICTVALTCRPPSPRSFFGRPPGNVPWTLTSSEDSLLAGHDNTALSLLGMSLPTPTAEPGPTTPSKKWRDWFRRPTPREQPTERIPLSDITSSSRSPAQEGQEDTKTAAKNSRLKFATTAARLHPDDLPDDYEPTEVYRGLDEYVHARRVARRRARRMRTRHRDDAEDSDSDSGSSSSSASSDSSGPIARLRAFFGDSSDSSSSSSSSSEDESSDSDASTDNMSMHSRATQDDGVSVNSSRSRRDSSAVNTPSASTAFSPWTPRISALTGTRKRKKKKKQKKTKEKPLHMVKASRMARRNARRLRELSGGVTEYTLFAPTGDNEPNNIKTQSWKVVMARLNTYFDYHKQQDGHAGDLGLPTSDRGPILSESLISPLMNDEADLALPPPALDPSQPVQQSVASQSPSETWEIEEEQMTGRHMSDIPLTPFIRSNATGHPPSSSMLFGGLVSSHSPTHQDSSMDAQTATHKRLPVSPIMEEADQLDGFMLPEAALDVDEKHTHSPKKPSPTTEAIIKSSLRSEPWWLDIRCPTYKDMRQLSLHFPLHPLTVEDILKQEQREKIESFERLGYYFVVVRAMDENYFRFTKVQPKPSSEMNTPSFSPALLEEQKIPVKNEEAVHEAHTSELDDGRIHIEMVKSDEAKEGLEGLGAGSMSLYIVVFTHGVLTFHFEDLSRHTERVRQRLNSSVVPVEHNADWIVHGLYDSIVDAFTPYVQFLQTEVEYVEYLSNDLSMSPFASENTQDERKKARKRGIPTVFAKKRNKDTNNNVFQENILRNLPQVNAEYVEYLAQRAKKIRSYSTHDVMQQSHFILRLTRVREVVMGLNRLLTPKLDVVRAVRKRLLEQHGLFGEDRIISMYFDDIFDHVSSMLVQLQDRDSGLSNTHSSFLYRTTLNDQRFHIVMGKRLSIMTCVLAIVFLSQFTCSLFGMNIYIPAMNQENELRPNQPLHPYFHAFGGLIGALIVYPFLVYAFYISLRKRAKARSKKKLERW